MQRQLIQLVREALTDLLERHVQIHLLLPRTGQQTAAGDVALLPGGVLLEVAALRPRPLGPRSWRVELCFFVCFVQGIVVFVGGVRVVVVVQILSRGDCFVESAGVAGFGLDGASGGVDLRPGGVAAVAALVRLDEQRAYDAGNVRKRQSLLGLQREHFRQAGQAAGGNAALLWAIVATALVVGFGGRPSGEDVAHAPEASGGFWRALLAQNGQSAHVVGLPAVLAADLGQHVLQVLLAGLDDAQVLQQLLLCELDVAGWAFRTLPTPLLVVEQTLGFGQLRVALLLALRVGAAVVAEEQPETFQGVHT